MNKNEYFQKNGIVKVKIYSAFEVLTLRRFVHSWISRNFTDQGIDKKFPANLSSYHSWAQKNDIPHDKLFSAPNRFCTPPGEIEQIILKPDLFKFFKSLNLKMPNLIDEGMGWLGYRIIRPNMNDGYPTSCKDWGASKGAFSIWLPLFTFSSAHSLKFVKGSHNHVYKNYLPADGKFTKDELRLSPSETVKLSSKNVFPGNLLFYGPRTLHSENVTKGRKTRINLEFRFYFEDSGTSFG